MTEKYIRQLVCKWVESGKLDKETAEKLLQRILKILSGKEKNSENRRE